jgi:hypothetical protein
MAARTGITIAARPLSLPSVASVKAASDAPAWLPKPIRVIVPTSRGGVDIVARAIGQRLTESWGQPVVMGQSLRCRPASVLIERAAFEITSHYERKQLSAYVIRWLCPL